jgi:hypothetical protein
VRLFPKKTKRRQREDDDDDDDDHDDHDDGRPGRLGFSSSFFFSRDFVDVFFAKEEERTKNVFVVDAERGNEQRRGEEEDGKQE